MLLLGTRNTSSQSILSDGLINLGSTYRKYDKKNNCGNYAFDFEGDSINLKQAGIYKITINATFTATATGDVTIQLFENGIAIPGALETETITTADTEIRSVSFTYFVLVDKSCVCGVYGTIAKSISVVNTGIASTITNVSVAITKEC